MKYIRVNMYDGTQWDIPASVIANNRARFYESEEPGCFNEEYNFTMEENEELLDWAVNNMNWEEVEDYAKMVPQEPEDEPDYSDDWINVEKEIVEY